MDFQERQNLSLVIKKLVTVVVSKGGVGHSLGRGMCELSGNYLVIYLEGGLY